MQVPGLETYRCEIILVDDKVIGQSALQLFGERCFSRAGRSSDCYKDSFPLHDALQLTRNGMT